MIQLRAFQIIITIVIVAFLGFTSFVVYKAQSRHSGYTGVDAGQIQIMRQESDRNNRNTVGAAE